MSEWVRGGGGGKKKDTNEVLSEIHNAVSAFSGERL